MTLRQKAGGIVGITTLVIMLLLYFVSDKAINHLFGKIEIQLTDGFKKVEWDEAQRNVVRIIDAFGVQMENLEAKTADWAQWDDTYAFVNDRNNAYRQSNLQIETFQALKIDMIVITDTAGEIVFSMISDTAKEATMQFTKKFQSYLRGDGLRLLQKSERDVLTGIIALPGGKPQLVSAQPVLKSNNTGPLRGTFIFGRTVDDKMLSELAAVTHLQLEWDLSENNAGLAAAGAMCDTFTGIHYVSDSLIDGHTTLNNINGKPVVALKVKMSREIFRHGKTTLAAIQAQTRNTRLMITTTVVITGGVLWIVLFIVLELSGLRRLRNIAKRTEQVGIDGTASMRLTVEGNDEIALLTVSINNMLEALGKSHEAIAVRDREKRALMNNLPIGVFSLNESLVVNPEYSRLLSAMFGVDECAGRHVNDLLAFTGSGEDAGTDLQTYLDLVRRRVLPEKEMLVLNPVPQFHFNSRNIDAWYRLQFYAMDQTDAGKTAILATVVDITEETMLGRERDDVQRENVQLRQIAENPDFFREFMRETRSIIENVKKQAFEYAADPSALLKVNTMFRGIHTIKGVAGSFGLGKIETITSELEELLSDLPDEKSRTAGGIEKLNLLLEELSNTFNEVIKLSSGLLGDVFDEECITVSIPVYAISRNIDVITDLLQNTSPDNVPAISLGKEILKLLKTMKAIPASKALARSLRMIPRLNERLGKSCKVILHGGAVLIDYETAQELNVVMVHLLRNAIDHGIEPGTQRLAAGKPEEGVLSISLDKNDASLRIVFSDDGRGMDVGVIKSTAIELGFISAEQAATMSNDALENIIFIPGFTTTHEITEISGRGIGLDTVATVVKKGLNGDISVFSTPGSGTTFTITLPA